MPDDSPTKAESRPEDPKGAQGVPEAGVETPGGTSDWELE